LLLGHLVLVDVVKVAHHGAAHLGSADGFAGALENGLKPFGVCGAADWLGRVVAVANKPAVRGHLLDGGQVLMQFGAHMRGQLNGLAAVLLAGLVVVQNNLP